jgi:adenine-specific DNA methylase
MCADKEKVYEVVCPHCQTVIWVDAAAGDVIKSERGARKKESLDDLLLREKKKKEGFERKFEATAELEKQKLQKAKEKFEKAISSADNEDK